MGGVNSPLLHRKTKAYGRGAVFGLARQCDGVCLPHGERRTARNGCATKAKISAEAGAARPGVLLEIQAEGELQVALAATNATALGEYFPERGTGRVEADIGCAAAAATAAPIRVVDEVVRLGAELETCFLGNGERLEQPEVPVLVSGLVDQVANALGVESSGRRLGKDRGVEPLAVGAEGPDDFRSAADDPVLAVLTATEVGVQAHSGVVRGACHAAGQASLELCDAGDLPPSQHLAAQRRVVFEEWQVVEVVEDEDVTSVEFRRAPQHAYVICVRD